MSATSKETIPSAVFHLYLKYQNKIAMMKLTSIKFPHLNPTSHLAKCQGKTGFDILLPHVLKQPGVQLHPSKQKSIWKQPCGLLSTWLASGYLIQIYLMYRFSDSTRGSKYLYHPHWLPWKDAEMSQHPKLAPESQPTQSAFHF